MFSLLPLRGGYQGSHLSNQPPSVAIVANCSMEELRASLFNLTVQERKNWTALTNEKGMTPLAIAVEAQTAKANKMDLITYLIKECGADPNNGGMEPNTMSTPNWTPLYRASTGERVDALEFLLNNGANPNIANSDQSTPLHRVTDRGVEGAVRILLAHKADVNTVNSFGTPLAYAAKNGNIPIAELLLDAGADPNLVNDPLAATPAALAENNLKKQMCQFLRDRGGMMNVALDSKVQTRISLLAASDNESEIIDSFHSWRSDAFGRSVAHYCAFHGRVDLLKKMRARGDIDIRDTKRRTPLHYAVINGQESAVAYMISREGKCSLESSDSQGYSPLMWACQFNQVVIAKSILNRAAESKILNFHNIRDNFGWTALHKSAQVGNLALVRLFVEECKADPHIKTNNDRTPLDLAITTNAIEVIDYLKRITVYSDI